MARLAIAPREESQLFLWRQPAGRFRARRNDNQSEWHGRIISNGKEIDRDTLF